MTPADYERAKNIAGDLVMIALEAGLKVNGGPERTMAIVDAMTREAYKLGELLPDVFAVAMYNLTGAFVSMNAAPLNEILKTARWAGTSG